jgi:hypothetical protein
MNHSPYTKAVGRKFHADGSVRYFPGNTIICPIPPDNAVYAELVRFAERLKALSCVSKFTLMPPSSYHMTVIQGVCEEDRKPELWSRDLPLDMPLEETDRYFRKKFAEIPIPHGFQMKFNEVETGSVALTLKLLPASDEDREALTQFRDRVSEQLGLRFPDHEAYQFHITIAYKIYELTGEEVGELQQFKEQEDREFGDRIGGLATPSPQLVFFKDMFEFASARP